MQELWLGAISAGGIMSASVGDDWMQTCACFPIKRAALWLAEQITIGESIKVALQDKQNGSHKLFFSLFYIFPLSLFLSSFIPSSPSSFLLKHWHTAQPKRIVFYSCF